MMGSDQARRYNNVTIKLRGDDALLLKQVVARANAKILDMMKLWPRCTACGFPLTQVASKIFCLNCGKEYKLSEA
jgi:rRNA maturation endonuclease Nob1